MANNAIDIWPAAYYAKGFGTAWGSRWYLLRCPDCGHTANKQYKHRDVLILAAIEFDREHTERCNNALHQARQSL